jgi:carboxypeptidase C (cathepsin A)
MSPNPFSWNKVASILYVEQPAGVGFSYVNTQADYTTGDAKATSDNYMLIREFLTRFPERQSNDFYIASESYGGHYMPHCKFVCKQSSLYTRFRSDLHNSQ